MALHCLLLCLPQLHYFWLFHLGSFYCWDFPGGSMVKNMPADSEDVGWFLSWEDPLEKKMTTPSSILVSEIPRIEEPGGLQYVMLQRVRHNWATKQDFIVSWNLVRAFLKNFSPIFFFFFEFHLCFITIMVIVYNNLADSHIWVKIFCEKATIFFSALYIIYLCRRYYHLCFDTSHLFFIPVFSRITFLSFNTKR